MSTKKIILVIGLVLAVPVMLIIGLIIAAIVFVSSGTSGNKAILKEAKSDYQSYIAPALANYFAEHSEYPNTLEVLNLPDEAMPSNSESNYEYSGGRSGYAVAGPYCTYRLSIAYPWFLGEYGGNDPLVSEDDNQINKCGSPEYLNRMSEFTASLAVLESEIKSDFIAIKQSLEMYRSAHGGYPFKLSSLGLGQPTITMSTDGEEYDYNPYYSNGYAYPDKVSSEKEICAFVLSTPFGYTNERHETAGGPCMPEFYRNRAHLFIDAN